MNEAKIRGMILTIMLGVASITATGTFVVVHTVRGADDTSKINMDGISCILEQLGEHRQNSFVADQRNAASHKTLFDAPAPAPQTLPRELIAACERFFGAP